MQLIVHIFNVNADKNITYHVLQHSIKIYLILIEQFNNKKHMQHFVEFAFTILKSHNLYKTNEIPATQRNITLHCNDKCALHYRMQHSLGD